MTGLPSDDTEQMQCIGMVGRGLRERVTQSSLTDAAAFTRNLEAAYRTIWGTWCDTDPSGH